MKLTGAIADIPNKSNTVYPNEVLKKAVEEYNETYSESYLFDQGSETNAVGKINNVKFENNCVFVDVDFFDSNRGLVCKALIENGMNLFVSTSGAAKAEKNEQGQLEIKNLTINRFNVSPTNSFDVKFVEDFGEG